MTPTRCGKCRRRTAKRHRLTWYVRDPRCACGGRLYEDRHRVLKERVKGRGTCGCDHYPFPHRHKSLFCTDGVLGRLGLSFYERNSPPAAELRGNLRAFGTLERAA